MKSNLKKILNRLKYYFGVFRYALEDASQKNSRFFEKMQLTSIYFCASVVLAFVIVNCLGFLPVSFYILFPFLPKLLTFGPLTFLARPEQTFFIYLLSFEFIINRNVFKFSELVKFNLMLIFIIEMLQNLVITLWDFLYVREIEIFLGVAISDDFVASTFFFFFFLFFEYLYIQAYIQSLNGKFPKYPPFLSFITDSIAFWLRVNYKNKR